MLGRAAYKNPWVLAELQGELFGNGQPANAVAVIEGLTDYLRRQAEAGLPVKHITRHLLGLFQGRPGGRIWRRYLSENAHRDDSEARILEQALDAMQSAIQVA